MTTNNKVLVTGGAGFIGSHLVPLLLERNYAVTVLDNLYSGKRENLRPISMNSNFRFEQGDIRNKNTVHKALRDIDIIIHLAALIDVSGSVADPFETHDVNVNGTLNILQEAVKNKVKKIIFASSTAVYGETRKLPIKEDTLLNPISPYAASKVAAESYCKAFAGSYGLDAITLRFFNVYGPRNENNPYSGVITKFLQKAHNNETLPVEGDGKQTRDFIHVNDVARAIVSALDTKKSKGEVFNVCTGKPTSINEIVDALRTVTGKDLKVTHGPPRIGDIRDSYGNPAKSTRKLGFRATVGLLDGLKTLIEKTENKRNV
jgi:UDP-glucose 4-epimerase